MWNIAALVIVIILIQIVFLIRSRAPFAGRVYSSYCSPSLRLNALKTEVSYGAYGYQRQVALEQLAEAVEKGLVDKSTAVGIAAPVLKRDRDSGARKTAAEVLIRSIDAKYALKTLLNSLEDDSSPKVRNSIISGFSDTWQEYGFERDIVSSLMKSGRFYEEGDLSFKNAMSLMRDILRYSNKKSYIRKKILKSSEKKVVELLESNNAIEEIVADIMAVFSALKRGLDTAETQKIFDALGPMPEPETENYVNEIVSLIERIEKLYELLYFYNFSIDNAPDLNKEKQHCEKRLVEIEKELSESGGIELMKLKYEEAFSQRDFKSRYLDLLWDGVGGWAK